MPKYSAHGYPAAVIMRSNRTLLVEGPNDKAIISRLFIELRNQHRVQSDNLLIDTAAEIPDAPGGNRQRVEDMHARVGGSGKFAALVDREFRKFDLVNLADQNPSHVEIPDNLFWTRGHSAENYLCDVRIFITSLENLLPVNLPQDYRRHLENAFPSILRNCASISLAAKEIGKLDRIPHLVALDHWSVKADGSTEINMPRMKSILADRGVSAPQCVAFEAEYNRCLAQLTVLDLPLSRWICHGHVSEYHIWSAVASTLRHHGMDEGIAESIAGGERTTLVKVSRGTWSRQCVSGTGDHPTALIQWLCN